MQKQASSPIHFMIPSWIVPLHAPVEIVIVHVDGVRAFVETDKRVDHRLAAEGNCDFVCLWPSEVRCGASSAEVPVRLGRFSLAVHWP